MTAAPITAEAVQSVLGRFFAAPKWNPAAAYECHDIAVLLRHHVAAADADASARRESKANGQSAARLRAALACDLPALAARARPVVAETEHGRALADLADAGARFVALWGEPPRQAIAWHDLANTLAPMARLALNRANPGRRVGLPRSARSPLAKAVAALLALAGVPPTLGSPGAVGKHFAGFWPGPL